jgi:hypothetical protein
VSVSSTYPGHLASYVNNGVRRSDQPDAVEAWASADGDGSPWVQLTLAADTAIAAVNVYLRAAYTDRDFDTTAYRVTHQMAHKDNTPVLAYANWNEGRIELREDSAHLVGSTYRLLLALVGSPSTRYSSSARADVTTWSPFVTDEAMLCLHGSMYSGSGDMKSVQVKKEAAAFDALKRLVARHFKVDFTNVDPTAQAA